MACCRLNSSSASAAPSPPSDSSSSSEASSLRGSSRGGADVSCGGADGSRDADVSRGAVGSRETDGSRVTERRDSLLRRRLPLPFWPGQSISISSSSEGGSVFSVSVRRPRFFCVVGVSAGGVACGASSIAMRCGVANGTCPKVGRFCESFLCDHEQQHRGPDAPQHP